MRNTITKIENTYGGSDFVIIGGDATVLSVFAAAACSVDLREHGQFELPAGEYYDLRELVSECAAGSFRGREIPQLSAREVSDGRDVLRDIGPNLFSETAAGSWVLGPGVRR